MASLWPAEAHQAAPTSLQALGLAANGVPGLRGTLILGHGSVRGGGVLPRLRPAGKGEGPATLPHLLGLSDPLFHLREKRKT